MRAGVYCNQSSLKTPKNPLKMGCGKIIEIKCNLAGTRSLIILRINNNITKRSSTMTKVLSIAAVALMIAGSTALACGCDKDGDKDSSKKAASEKTV